MLYVHNVIIEIIELSLDFFGLCIWFCGCDALLCCTRLYFGLWL